MLVLENDTIYTQEERSQAACCSKKKQVICHLCHTHYSCQMLKCVCEKTSFLLGLLLRNKDMQSDGLLILELQTPC